MSGSRSYPASDASESSERNEVVLSLKTVHKMLPLVQQIAQEIVARHRAIERLQPEEECLDQQRRSLAWPMRRRRYEVKDELARAEKDLETAIAELRGLGLSVLNEVDGVIGFPTVVNDRRAFFSWHVGEVGVKTWRFADEDVDRPIPPSWMKELGFASK